MALIRPLSDIHIDAATYRIHMSADEKNTILVIAGDLCPVDKTALMGNFLKDAADRFKHVVYVAGNHEYWGSSLIRAPQKINETIAKFNLANVHYLQNDCVVLDGVAFIGSTMWSEVRNPVTVMQVANGMNDYRKIRTGTASDPYARKARVSDTVVEFDRAKTYIFAEIEHQKLIGNKVYVVTHHAPSHRSIDPKYQYDAVNAAYYTSLDIEVEDASPDFWQHGHIHWMQDYYIGTCRVICNPKGYEDYHHIEHTNYVPAKVIEV